MADWSTISSLATAGGTLVLAVATFASVRSGRHSAQVTERALMASTRPLLLPSRLEDPPEKVGFMDDHYVRVKGGHAVAEINGDAIYLAIALRNVGTGLAVLDRWDLWQGRARDTNGEEVRDIEQFRRLTRDLYIAGGDRGFWQGALRDPTDPAFDLAKQAIIDHTAMTVDLLYDDHEGGQRAITRMGILPVGEDDWLVAVSRHWNLDRSDPR